jgi:hypothetical protein
LTRRDIPTILSFTLLSDLKITAVTAAAPEIFRPLRGPAPRAHQQTCGWVSTEAPFRSGEDSSILSLLARAGRRSTKRIASCVQLSLQQAYR